MQSFFKRFILVLIFSFPCFSAFSQSIQIKYSGNRSYTLVERSNLRRYVNGKYSGLTSREVRSFISAAEDLSGASYSSAAKPQYYSGNFYVMEETLRNSKSVSAGIHKAIPSVFSIDSDGQMKMIEDNGYPSFRSFPGYTAENLKSGDSWKAKAERAADPLNKGVFTRMPIQVLYTFSGEEVYNGEKVYRIKAIWQTNYGFSNFYKDPQGDDSLEKATGGHKADIIVRKSTGEAILINDSVDETFFYSGGTQVAFKGTITLFTEYPPAVDRSKLLMNLQRVASILPKTENQNGDQNNRLNGGQNVAQNNSQNDSVAPGGLKSGSETVFPENGSDAKKSGKTSGKDLAYLEKTGQKEKSAQTAHNDESTRTAEETRASEGTRVAESTRNAEKESVLEKLPDIAETPKNNMLVEETAAGIRLSIRDIKFMPDSAQIVAGENSRLDSVASILKTVPNQLLIEGHTASVGKPAGEQKLSAERAEAIAAELVKRGISADRLICKGMGGKNPVADNSTASGRAQNRRVEITILE